MLLIHTYWEMWIQGLALKNVERLNCKVDWNATQAISEYGVFGMQGRPLMDF